MVELRADCARCVGLCCVAPAFARSADFALDKPAGAPCPNLRPDFGCDIHDDLRPRGFAGCTVFDCLGAGPRVTRAFAGRDWRSDPSVAGPMFDAFSTARQVHELLFHLDEARVRAPDPAVDDELTRLSVAPVEDWAAGDVAATRERVGELLGRASERVRAAAGGRTRDHRRADLAGARLRRADLHGATLRGRCCSARTCATRTCGWPTSSAPTCGGPTCAARTSRPACSSRRCRPPRPAATRARSCRTAFPGPATGPDREQTGRGGNE